MRYMGEALYPPEFCLEVDVMRSVWFQYMLEDEACTMKLPAGHLDMLTALQTFIVSWPWPQCVFPLHRGRATPLGAIGIISPGVFIL